MKVISPESLKAKKDANEKYCLLDIREPYEYEICTIGGLQIPMGEVVSRIDELPKDQTIVVMCRSGSRAAAMANLLETDYNFEDIAVLDGGILGWIEAVDQSLEAY